MMLKKFFGKTIEVAKKSARQMYGDDIVILESFHADEKNDAGVTVLVDEAISSAKKRKPEEKNTAEEETPFRNVFYKRRDALAPSGQSGQTTAGGHHPSADGSPEDPPQKRKTEFKRSSSLTDSSLPDSNKANDNHVNSDQVNSSQPDNTQGNSSLRNSSQKNNGSVSNNLRALREYATRDDQNTDQASLSGKTRFKPGAMKGRFFNTFQSNETAGEAGETHPADPGESTDNAQSTTNGQSQKLKSTIFDYDEPALSGRFQASRDVAADSFSSGTPTAANNQREITALHKRFDKLESLLDSALISSNLDYASHPAFQQLVQTGIKPTVIARWFREIIETGIDPDQETEQFMAGLSSIIRKALKGSSNEPWAPFMMFAGPSGSGKTSLIMKLVQHPEFMSGKNVAVVSIIPQNREKQPYYTILEPFCNDQNITYYKIGTSTDVNGCLEEWKTYDHVLFDSPSIPVEQERSFREYWKIRQLLAAVTPLEVHYVINAALNRYYFRESGNMHHPLQPDYVALTHLDEVSQWGPVIPFMQEMGCGARFMSRGSGIPGGLSEFSPAWFTQQVLQDT